jgi:hypothetical protein
MNLNSRLSRIEASQLANNPPVVIVAADEADYREQLEGVLLSAKPGLLALTGTIAGVAFEHTTELLAHEKMLELLS